MTEHDNPPLLLVGGGLGGMGLALASARAGVAVGLLEQTTAFTEVGAGLQLGPNAVRVLHDWGLASALGAVAAFPEHLVARDAFDGRVLGRLALGERALARYGQPYATVHRADALALLYAAVQQQPEVVLHLGQRLRSVGEHDQGVEVHTESGQTWAADALVGCDGLWSVVRRHVAAGPAGLKPGREPPWGIPPRFSGHVAYRGLLPMASVPVASRQSAVTAWLGPRLHVVHYPVRRGEWMNVVAVVHGRQTANPQSWSHEANRVDLRQALGDVHPRLTDLLEAVPSWTLWPLNDRPPMTGPYQHAQSRVALLGDAAHPMRPYLAQGAAMALEDAWTLGTLLAQAPKGQAAQRSLDWPRLFQRYSNLRWPRNARVQAQSVRNGRVFHARGWVRAARNLALRVADSRLMDKPWLYSGPPRPL